MPVVRIKVNPTHKQAVEKFADPKFRKHYLDHLLHEMSLSIPGAIASWIQKTQPFNVNTGDTTARWRAQITGDRSLHVTALHAYYYWLNYGVRPHQMIYLLNAELRTYTCFGHPYLGRAYIPIRSSHLKGASVVFRRPTEKAMAAGKWRHPGYTGRHFLENALEDYVTTLSTAHPEIVLSYES